MSEITDKIKWRLGGRNANVRMQAADLIARIAPSLKQCGEENALKNMGKVLYEYLGEEYPDVLGSILGSLGESALAKSMQLSTYDWTIFFSRPFAAFFMISGIIAILLTIWRGIREVVQRRNADLPQ